MKTVEEIYQALLEDFFKAHRADVSHSCDLAVRLYAVAAQVQALYVQMDWVQRQSFPQTARGVYLDYHAQTRALERRAAVKATGTMRFSVRTAPQEDLAIPAGTVCLNAVGCAMKRCRKRLWLRGKPRGCAGAGGGSRRGGKYGGGYGVVSVRAAGGYRQLQQSNGFRRRRGCRRR